MDAQEQLKVAVLDHGKAFARLGLTWLALWGVHRLIEMLEKSNDEERP